MITTIKGKNLLLLAVLIGTLLLGSAEIYSQAPDWLWAKSAGGIHYDRGTAITYGSDGNLLVSGYFAGSATFDTTVLTSALTTDVFIAKYTPMGDLLWAKSAASSTAGTPLPNSIFEDGSGNIYLVGSFGYYDGSGGGGDIKFNDVTTFTSRGNQDLFIAKYDSEADFIWAKHIGSTQVDKIVSTMDVYGNIIISGKLWSTVYFNSTTDTLFPFHLFDIFLAKFDTSGTLKFYGNAASCSAVIEPQDITTDKAGNIYLAGTYNGTPTFGLPVDSIDLETDIYYQQGFIARYEPLHGGYIWAYTAGNTSSYDYPATLNENGEGKIIMSGVYNSTASFGVYPDTLTLSAPPAAGYGEMYLVQYDTSGNADWAINAGYASGGTINYIDSYLSDGKIYITGDYSAGPCLFGQGAGAITVYYAHSLFVVNFDDTGNLGWVNTAGGPYSEESNSMVVDTLANVYITGMYDLACTFPGTSISLSAAGYEDILVARLNDMYVYLNESELNRDQFVFPNPASDEVTINLGKETNRTVQILNMEGKVLFQQATSARQMKIDLRNFPQGIYFITVTDMAGKKITNRILKI